jgi:RimJ/RimL family protein N-acetyltransferase
VLDVRPATMADTDLLFGWANDATTRAWSKSTQPISREEHERWMSLNVLTGYPAHWVMIAHNDFGDVGVVRFDMVKGDVMSYEVSITIGSDHRGKGYGCNALERACQIMFDSTLIAEIKSSNMASRRIFEHCGFEAESRSSTSIIYRREPL